MHTEKLWFECSHSNKIVWIMRSHGRGLCIGRLFFVHGADGEMDIDGRELLNRWCEYLGTWCRDLPQLPFVARHAGLGFPLFRLEFGQKVLHISGVYSMSSGIGCNHGYARFGGGYIPTPPRCRWREYTEYT